MPRSPPKAFNQSDSRHDMDIDIDGHVPVVQQQQQQQQNVHVHSHNNPARVTKSHSDRERERNALLAYPVEDDDEIGNDVPPFRPLVKQQKQKHRNSSSSPKEDRRKPRSGVARTVVDRMPSRSEPSGRSHGTYSAQKQLQMKKDVFNERRRQDIKQQRPSPEFSTNRLQLPHANSQHPISPQMPRKNSLASSRREQMRQKIQSPHPHSVNQSFFRDKPSRSPSGPGGDIRRKRSNSLSNAHPPAAFGSSPTYDDFKPYNLGGGGLVRHSSSPPRIDNPKSAVSRGTLSDRLSPSLDVVESKFDPRSPRPPRIMLMARSPPHLDITPGNDPSAGGVVLTGEYQPNNRSQSSVYSQKNRRSSQEASEPFYNRTSSLPERSRSPPSEFPSQPQSQSHQRASSTGNTTPFSSFESEEWTGTSRLRVKSPIRRHQIPSARSPSASCVSPHFEPKSSLSHHHPSPQQSPRSSPRHSPAVSPRNKPPRRRSQRWSESSHELDEDNLQVKAARNLQRRVSNRSKKVGRAHTCPTDSETSKSPTHLKLISSDNNNNTHHARSVSAGGSSPGSFPPATSPISSFTQGPSSPRGRDLYINISSASASTSGSVSASGSVGSLSSVEESFHQSEGEYDEREEEDEQQRQEQQEDPDYYYYSDSFEEYSSSEGSETDFEISDDEEEEEEREREEMEEEGEGEEEYEMGEECIGGKDIGGEEMMEEETEEDYAFTSVLLEDFGEDEKVLSPRMSSTPAGPPPSSVTRLEAIRRSISRSLVDEELFHKIYDFYRRRSKTSDAAISHREVEKRFGEENIANCDRIQQLVLMENVYENFNSV